MTNQNTHILIIDDEPSICEVLQDILEDEGYSVTTASNGELAHAAIKARVFDTIFMDIWMPDIDGITLLKEFQSKGNQSPIVMISGHGTVETAVEAIQFGAYDFLEKPLSTAKLLITLNRALESRAQNKELAQLRKQLEPTSTLIGNSGKLKALRELISRIGKTASWVMISGAPGSGKGVAARALHQASGRSASPFVEISLAAIPAQNLGRRLFGSEEDGVIQVGCFEQAEGGTLYLDEIGDLSNSMQTKLLSALQAGRFLRVGGHQPIEVDVRIICSTNQAIEKMVKEGGFRQDLYYRLNVMQVHVPSLNTLMMLSNWRAITFSIRSIPINCLIDNLAIQPFNAYNSTTGPVTSVS
jgi:two-component system nitrogen regulation response regulator NtrX